MGEFWEAGIFFNNLPFKQLYFPFISFFAFVIYYMIIESRRQSNRFTISSNYKFKLFIMHYLFVFVLALLGKFVNAATYPPTWITSNYLQAASKKVIDGDATGNTVGNSDTPTATIPFPTAFAAIPNLGYGIASYAGDDGLGQEMFEVNRTGLTTTAFSVLVQISGYTHIWVLQVRFIGIDRAFPHHLNSFDNVPINYNNGALTVLPTNSTSPHTYSNTINYTQQATATGSTYTTFSTPLSNNKILLFLTSMFMQGSFEVFAFTPSNPIDLYVTATPVSTTTYTLSATLGIKVKCTRLHFSMITFDQADVQASGLYLLIYDQVCHTETGGVYNFPSQFLTNFMIGFVEFSADRTASCPDFENIFGTYSGNYGTKMPASNPRNPLLSRPINRFCFNIFYLKTWTCPTGSVFDPALNLCTDCTLGNCDTCFNTTRCKICDPGFSLDGSGLCQPCTVVGCVSCVGVGVCGVCDVGLNYVLVAGGTCQHCDTANNYFANNATSTCDLCAISHCVTCSSLTDCQLCNTAQFYYADATHQCAYCDPGLNMLIHPTSFTCQACTLTGCLNCSTLSTCRTCNQPGNYFLGGDNLCHLCTAANCQDCLNVSACSICASGFVKNPATLQCEVCTLAGCVNCTDSVTCVQCNTGLNYVLLVSHTCQLCTPPTTFVNSATSQCEACTLAHCTTCASLTTCQVCDYANSWYVLGGGTCGFCNAGADNFINMVTKGCDPCTIPHCLKCSSLTTCLTCDEASQYFKNATDSLCYLCSPTNCLDCYNMTACNICDTASGYLLNSVTKLCELCPTGLFPNLTSNLCEACTLAHCTTCASLTACQLCDYNNSWYVLGNGTCGYCDALANNFINMATKGCQPCTLSFCLTCSSLTACTTCDEASQYFRNPSDSLCYHCSPTNCLDCYNMTACNICDINSGYILNPGTKLCQLCPTGLFPNATSGLCEACTLAHCTTCASLTVCQICDYNNSWYVLAGGTCGYCDSLLNNFINMATKGCQPCTLSFCLNCSSLTACTTCNEASNYFLNPSDSLCYHCSPTNCLDCYNMTTCNICDINTGYVVNSSGLCDLCPTGLFPNATSRLCEPCSVAHCTTCATLVTCQTCDYNNSWFLLGDLSCGYCDNAVDNFINMSTLGCQACSIPYCTDCASLTTCVTCNGTALYLLNSTDFLCYPCTLSDCILCTNFTACTLCNETTQHFLNYTTDLCQPCALTGCINCSSLEVCHQCNASADYGFDFTSPNMSLCGGCNVSCICDGYGMPWDPVAQACTAICGDGLIRVNEECDDNNTDSYDGCSSSCVVEPYYVCDGAEPTHCNQTLYIEAQFLAIAKEGCNGFKVTVNVPRFTVDQIRQNIHILNVGVNVVRSVQNGSSIQVYGEYIRDIFGETIQLHFSPGELLNIVYSPSIPALFYNADQCRGAAQTQKLLQAAQGISYTILILSMLSCKIVGLELFGVLQLSYFTLSSHSFLNLYLSPLVNFRTFNGLNVGITNESSELPESYKKMGVAGIFLNNCNVMLFLLFGWFIATVLFYIVSKLVGKTKVQEIALRLLKQGFITLVLFNIFNVSFSAGVHWKYGSPSDDGYAVSSFILYGTLIAMIVSVAALELTDPEHYGEFKNKFKDTFVCQIFICLTAVYRAILGFYMAVKSDYQESTLIILSFAIMFMLYLIINLPFSDAYQNYRCSLIHLTMLYSLLTTNYYRSMKSTTPMQIKGRLFTPAIIELTLILACIVVSLAALVYEIYRVIRQSNTKRKVQNKKLAESRQMTSESFASV